MAMRRCQFKRLARLAFFRIAVACGCEGIGNFAVRRLVLSCFGSALRDFRHVELYAHMPNAAFILRNIFRKCQQASGASVLAHTLVEVRLDDRLPDGSIGRYFNKNQSYPPKIGQGEGAMRVGAWAYFWCFRFTRPGRPPPKGLLRAKSMCF